MFDKCTGRKVNTVDGPITLVNGFILSGGKTASALEKAKTTVLLALVAAAVGAAAVGALVVALGRLLRVTVLVDTATGTGIRLGHLYLGQSK